MEKIINRVNIIYEGNGYGFNCSFWADFNCNENSKTGAKGALKKVLYWVVIYLAFYISKSFSEMGKLIGIDLNFFVIFGWFTLAVSLVNEIRSILENFVEMGVKVPSFLIKGLEVTEKAIDKITKNE